MYVVASDGVETQARKLKPTVSLPKAKMLVKNLQDTDYLGLKYWLEAADASKVRRNT